MYRAAPRWPAGLPVLAGACQFGHGLGGFTADFIHSLFSLTTNRSELLLFRNQLHVTRDRI